MLGVYFFQSDDQFLYFWRTLMVALSNQWRKSDPFSLISCFPHIGAGESSVNPNYLILLLPMFKVWEFESFGSLKTVSYLIFTLPRLCFCSCSIWQVNSLHTILLVQRFRLWLVALLVINWPTFFKNFRLFCVIFVYIYSVRKQNKEFSCKIINISIIKQD